jgi:hypothetical protein
MKMFLFCAIFFFYSLGAMAWDGDTWKGIVNDQGHIHSLTFHTGKGEENIPFLPEGKTAGPSFYVNMGGVDTMLSWRQKAQDEYVTSIDQVKCYLVYTSLKGYPAIQITIKNVGHTPFQPVKAGIKLGIDTYMDKYPEWSHKFFPTLMYNEKSHFYGYMQSPSGSVIALVCPQPIASWSVAFNHGYQDPAPHWFMGHRILSLNLDLMNALPLPAHHPQDLWSLNPQDSLTWTISLFPTTMRDLFPMLHQAINAPMLQMEQTSYDRGDVASFFIYGTAPKVKVLSENGHSLPLNIKRIQSEKFQVSCRLSEPGLYNVQVVDGNKCAEGKFSVHHSWEWCMRRARVATLQYKQKATSHAESWYGFYSAFIAARYFPDAELDKKVSDRFEYLFSLLHDVNKMEPKYYKSRIQNTATTIGILVAKYQASHQENDIRRASQLADWLIQFSQAPNGAYMNGRTIYTSVIYVAKSILELYLEEKKLGQTDAGWKAIAERHYLSAKKAIDQLVDSNGNFQTEGEMTFEDGMISCSALQIGMFALLQSNQANRQHYTNAMLKILNSHDCLTQLRVPDARRRGGTLRYWEAQYDVQMLPNMFNSPHGWSGWRCYATYYAYLLTGDARWMIETYNAMGAFSNLLDGHTGQLRWAFIDDPYLKVRQTCEPDRHYTADSLSFGNPHPDLYPTQVFVIGEQYVNMISDWQGVNTQDNDVHEVFKCMGEVTVANAFVIENTDGSFMAFNCKVRRQGNRLIVTSLEKQVDNLHYNLKHRFLIDFNAKKLSALTSGMGWLKP